MASFDLRVELECSICLEIYTDPVTLRCGHNFCRVCIDDWLDTQEGSGRYFCPECKKRFPDRPEPQRNFTLRNIVENFLSAQTHQEGPGVFCTHCVDSPVPAVRSCLHCEVSLCDKHLRVHKKSPEHVLCDPTLSMETRKCSVHKKILEYYCTDDDTCVCVSCTLVGEHQGHRVEILAEAAEKKKNKLRNVLQELLIKREKMEERVQSLQEHRRKVEDKSAGDTETITAMFRDLRRRLDDLEKKVLSEISRKTERVSRSVLDMIQKLEIKKDKLSREMEDIEKLCNMTDPLTVLQESGDLCDTEDGDDEDKDRHDKLLHDGRGLEMDGIFDTLHTLSNVIRGVNVSSILQGAVDILLDVNTAGNDLHISRDRKTASKTYTDQKRAQTPERFECSQVLSSQKFSSGRHYWDVDVGEKYLWRIGVCYPSMERRGWGQLLIGNNSKSWCLYNCGGECYVLHDNKSITSSAGISGNKVRIELDYEAGRISFYDLCDPIQQIHTITATFTEPLHAAFFVNEDSLKICGGKQQM